MGDSRDVFQPVQFLKGVGPRRAALLERLGIRTLYDLACHFPARYYDRRTLVPLKSLRPGPATVQGVVTRVHGYMARRHRLPILEVSIRDATGQAVLVWFGQRFREKDFHVGDTVLAAGTAAETRAQVRVEEFEILEEGQEPLHAAGLVPAYPTTEGLSRRQIRALVRTALAEVADRMTDLLPEALRAKRKLPDVARALRQIHAPGSPAEAAAARRRFAYEELFLLQVQLAIRRRALRSETASAALPVGKALDFRIRALFPFRLTGAQERAVAAVRRDLAAGPPMNRLLQGDVGSGKTIVAAYALLAAVGNRAQAALMAPTEILAEQHARTFARLLQGSRVRVGFLAGSLREKERADVLARAASGDVDLVIGTHALLQRDVSFRKLGLVVVDEQQKFGVLQRAALRFKGARPHTLVMTATPIPRTLALTLYGDLDLTLIDEMPPGRREVRTMYVPPAGRREKYAFIRRKLREGRQAYFVYPLIDDSDALALRSALRMFEELRREFSGFAVGLLHGRMRPEEKEAALADFRSGRTAILVSTLVIEVGIDVPNASIMVIDDCERHGLSQLHQLRGRIGRGPYESFCLLFGRKNERIEAFVATSDGFKIAEADLRLRGAGELSGTRQSGDIHFKAVRFPEDLPILERAREDARALTEADPELRSAPELREALAGRPDLDRLLHVG